MNAESEAVLHFWFEALAPAQWWKKDPTVDDCIRNRFGELHRRAVACELSQWRCTSRGRLAEIIVIDQFSRNIFRDRPEAFAWDPLALALAQEAVAAGADRALEGPGKAFLYMPYMHSESSLIHETAMELFNAPGLEDNLKFEQRHKDIIDRFGRYPHRNAILDRESTDEERAFLKQPGSGF